MGDVDDTKPLMHLVVPARSAAASTIVDVDVDLVDRARRGDRAAYGQLFERHHRRIHGMCTRLLRASGDVDDAVQTTFLEGWKSLHRFEGKSRFTTWLTRIAIHTCFSVRRRLKRLLLVDGQADGDDRGLRLLEQLDDGSGPPHPHLQRPLAADEVASRHARERALQDVLAGLSEKKRAVFVLIDLEDLISPEVAEILGVNEATVRTRLFYARKEVAEALRTHPGFADLARVRR
ncbi:MAG TPA: RNA polymerase sigma factor [Myxococcota bacterium]